MRLRTRFPSPKGECLPPGGGGAEPDAKVDGAIRDQCSMSAKMTPLSPQALGSQERLMGLETDNRTARAQLASRVAWERYPTFFLPRLGFGVVAPGAVVCLVKESLTPGGGVNPQAGSRVKAHFPKTDGGGGTGKANF